MPVTATRLAEVGTRDPHPLVIRRRGEHLLQQLAVTSLDHGALAQGQMGSRDPLGKGITHLLELLETGDPRLGKTCRHTGIELQSRESLGFETAQLVLEPPNLAAQLSACKALIASHAKRCKRVSVEQLLHDPKRV